MDLNTEIARNVTAALAEDVGSGDLTAQLAPDVPDASAHVVCRQAAVLCGTAWFDACVHRLDPAARVAWPGRYGSPEDTRGEAKWRGTGIRTEDDVLVTRDAPKVLTAKLARSSDEIEAFLADARATA